jgi:hypothetical protein
MFVRTVPIVKCVVGLVYVFLIHRITVLWTNGRIEKVNFRITELVIGNNQIFVRSENGVQSVLRQHKHCSEFRAF